MGFSDTIAEIIRQMLRETDDGIAEIQRNELANRLGCVPSQINYVITSRFTPEHGYLVESRRGGGGYIRITRVKFSESRPLMHVINCIGDRIDSESARIFLGNLKESGTIDERSARLMQAALSDKAYHTVPQTERDALRAAVFKQMLAAMLR